MWAVSLAVLGCGGNASYKAAEPPAGVVDLQGDGLASPGASAGAAPASSASPAGGGAQAGGGDFLGPTPGIGAAAGAEAAARAEASASGSREEPTGEAAATITMTREHCETLGRKFAELVMAQGGGMGAGMGASTGDKAALKEEGTKLGRDFAKNCARDMGGQKVLVSEYQCMLKARAANELLGCKK